MTQQGTTTSRTPVTVIGLGQMGVALAGALLAAGHPTTVWNRSPGKADELVERGARRAATPAEAVSAGEVVIVCVLDYPAVREILASAEPAGRVIVNLTTGTPDEARELDGWISDRGAEYLDGVIMAGPALIGRPEAMILYGGARAAFDAHQRTLRVLADNSPFLVTDTGVPTLYDLALLGMLWSTAAGWLHAFALVGTANVTAAEFRPYADTWFRNVVAAEDSAELARDVDRREYPDTARSSLALNASGLDLLVRASADAGVNAEMFGVLRKLAERRVADGHGADGFTSLIEALGPTAAQGSTP